MLWTQLGFHIQLHSVCSFQINLFRKKKLRCTLESGNICLFIHLCWNISIYLFRSESTWHYTIEIVLELKANTVIITILQGNFFTWKAGWKWAFSAGDDPCSTHSLRPCTTKTGTATIVVMNGVKIGFTAGIRHVCAVQSSSIYPVMDNLRIKITKFVARKGVWAPVGTFVLNLINWKI